MAYSYKGAISFGLVYIPITLYPCIAENGISFNLLEKKTLSRVKYIKTCVDCDEKAVHQKDIVKGYQYQSKLQTPKQYQDEQSLVISFDL